MARSYPVMPIHRAQEPLRILEEYKQFYDRYIAVTIVLDEFAHIATEKSYAVAEAGLAMFCDQLSGSISSTTTIIRVDISTVFLVVSTNEIDPREVVEKRIKTAIRNSVQGGWVPRYSFAMFPDDSTNAEALMLRMKATMPSSWKNVDGVIEKTEGVDFKKEMDHGNVVTYVQGVYTPEKILRGVELLARWKSDLVGVVPPSEFMDAINEQELSLPFLNMLLKDAKYAFQQIATALGESIVVSLNLSPLSLMKPEFIDLLELFSKENDVSYIEIELIETDDFEKLVGFSEILSKISSFGYRLAIDDFGSRYAWINSLGEYIRTIKLDRTFTQRLSKGSQATKAEMVVSSVIRMARDLSIEVIAEGVEDFQDFEVMVAKGVSGLQGYYFSKPKPLSDFINEFPLRSKSPKILNFAKLSSTPTRKH